MYQILLSRSSERFLRKCDKELYERLIKKIKELSLNPFPPDIKRVIGIAEKTFRVRVGGYRIQYVVFHEKSEILILDIDKRPRAY